MDKYVRPLCVRTTLLVLAALGPSRELVGCYMKNTIYELVGLLFIHLPWAGGSLTSFALNLFF